MKNFNQEDLAFNEFVSKLSGFPIEFVNTWMGKENVLTEEPYSNFCVGKEESIEIFKISSSILERANKLIPELNQFEFGFRLCSYLKQRANE